MRKPTEDFLFLANRIVLGFALIGWAWWRGEIGPVSALVLALHGAGLEIHLYMHQLAKRLPRLPR